MRARYCRAISGRSGMIPNTADVLFPSGKGLIDWFAGRQVIEIGRDVRDSLAIPFIGGADVEFIQFAEHIQLGNGQAGEAVEAHRIVQDDRVQPAAASTPAGGGAELRSGLLYTVPISSNSSDGNGPAPTRVV
jgi:hypothetical protein